MLSQTLIPLASGKGRALALEVMVPNAAIRNLIREDKIHQLYSSMQLGQGKFGMQTMNQSLAGHVGARTISMDDASGRSPDVEELKKLIASQSLAKSPDRKSAPGRGAR